MSLLRETMSFDFIEILKFLHFTARCKRLPIVEIVRLRSYTREMRQSSLFGGLAMG